MAFNRVAELVQRAVQDTGVLHALKNDPKRLQKAIGLTGAQLDALNSATAFPLPVRSTTTRSNAAGVPFGMPSGGAVHTEAFILNMPGSLLPPEGSGQFTGATSGFTPPPVGPGTPPPSPSPVVTPPPPAPIPPTPVATPTNGPPPRPPMPPPVIYPPPVAPCPPPQVVSPMPAAPTALPPSIATQSSCCECCAVAGMVSVVAATAVTAITAITAISSRAARR